MLIFTHVTCDMFSSDFWKGRGEWKKKKEEKKKKENISKTAWLAQDWPPHLSHVTGHITL